MNRKIRYLLAILAGLAVLSLTAASLVRFFTTEMGEGNMQVAGANCFRFFTVDSNLLAALSALVMLPFEVRGLCAPAEPPRWAVLLKFAGTSAVTVTFLTVLAFLGPTQGYADMFAGVGLYLHLICPLLMIVSFILLEPAPGFSAAASVWGAVPSLIYGLLYMVMVVIVGADSGGWADFYGFNRNGLWPVSFAAMLLASWLIARLLRYLRGRVCGKTDRAAAAAKSGPDA